MRYLFTFVLSVIMASFGFAQQSPINLYPNGIPNSKPTPSTYTEKRNGDWLSEVSIPTLTPYLPEKGLANGTAVIVLPGGGYSGLAAGHEGKAIAEAFNKIGVTAFVLKYRLPSDLIMIDKTIGPLQDAQRAIQLVREDAAKWNINPNKIGIIGFSAGGHLASTAGTHFDKEVIDNKKKTSLRPDFMMLIYPVISFGEFTHAGSKENLTGKTPSQPTTDLYSNEKQVTPNTPPTFLLHAGDDTVVPVQNSLMFYEALLKNKVSAEMHIYPAGGHGFGLTLPGKEQWFERLANWMAASKLIP